jgi:hypothetical protein
MMNPAIFAMEMLQKEMEGEWERAGIRSEEDLNRLIKEMRGAGHDGHLQDNAQKVEHP